MRLSYIALTALVSAVIFVNGFTDAPNAITSVVCTGALRFRAAAALAAGCNILGLLLAWRFAPRVSSTICEMADFSRADNRAAMAALVAAMCAVVVFALAAWVFGIPTSESHALIAALSGAAVALQGPSALSPAAWGAVLLGLLLSSLGGLLAGYGACRWGARALERLGTGASRRVGVLCAACMALLHGAQDGLKFIGVLLTAEALLRGGTLRPGQMDVSAGGPAALLCGAVMALGTLVGGKRIVAAVGQRMVGLDSVSGAASDLAAFLVLLPATVAGVPMSTTHTKTCAVLGAGLARGRGPVAWGTVGGMVFAWAVTFPACAAIGWLIVRLALFQVPVCFIAGHG